MEIEFRDKEIFIHIKSEKAKQAVYTLGLPYEKNVVKLGISIDNFLEMFPDSMVYGPYNDKSKYN